MAHQDTLSIAGSSPRRISGWRIAGWLLALLPAMIPLTGCGVTPCTSARRPARRASEQYDASADRWRSRPRLPQPVAGARAVTVGGLIYVIGGGDGRPFGRAWRTAYRYDPVSRVWETLPEMTLERDRHGVAAVGTDIYVLGGAADPSGVEVLDTTTDTWRINPAMPNPHLDFDAVSIGTSIFAPGGDTDLFDVLDTTTGQWTPLTPLPMAKAGAAVATDGMSIYMMGGSDPPSQSFQGSDELWIYDVGTDTWAAGPVMPEMGNYLAATIDGARLYLFGTFGPGPPGRFGVLEDRRRVLVLNVSTLFWAEGKRKPDGNYAVAPVAEGGLIYIFGGWGKTVPGGCDG